MYSGPKLIIAGWDAGCWQLLQPLVENGRLKNLRKIMDSGVYGALSAPLPALTPVSWSTIGTGCDPGGHGIYSWWRPAAGTYMAEAFDSTSLKTPHILQYLSEQGMKVGAIGVPMTYPPFMVNGFLISGIGNPNSVADWSICNTYPGQLAEFLEKHHQEIFSFDFSRMAKAKCNEELLTIWKDYEKHRRKLIADLVRKEKPDVLWVHCHAGDYFGHRVAHDSHVLFDAFDLVDETIGFLVGLSSPGGIFTILSDHGQTEIKSFLLVQNVLRDCGWLKFEESIPKERFGNAISDIIKGSGKSIPSGDLKDLIKLAGRNYYHLPAHIQKIVSHLIESGSPGSVMDHNNIDWDNTAVYSFEPGGLLRINLKGRERNGVVDPSDYDNLIDKVINKFEAICNPETGENLGIRVYRASEIYGTDMKVPRAPDLIIDISNRSTYVCNTHSLHQGSRDWVVPIDVNRLNGRFRFLDQEFYGDHTREGIYVFTGGGIQTSGKTTSILAKDIAPTILKLLGMRKPICMEGTAVNL